MAQAGAPASTTASTEASTTVVHHFWDDDPNRPQYVQRKKDGQLHSEEVDEETGLLLPAFESWRVDGTLNFRIWYRDGSLHRTERDPETGLQLSALQEVGVCETLVEEWWYVEGEHFCVDEALPNVICRSVLGNIGQFWYYSQNGDMKYLGKTTDEFGAIWEEQRARFAHYFDPIPTTKAARNQ